MTLELLFAQANQGRTFLLMALCGCVAGIAAVLAGRLHRRSKVAGLLADGVIALLLTLAAGHRPAADPRGGLHPPAQRRKPAALRPAGHVHRRRSGLYLHASAPPDMMRQIFLLFPAGKLPSLAEYY